MASRGVARATERWIEPHEELTLALEQFVGEDEVEALVAYAWTFRNGKVIHFRSYRDPDEALEAVGLSE